MKPSKVVHVLNFTLFEREKQEREESSYFFLTKKTDWNMDTVIFVVEFESNISLLKSR